MSHYKEVQARKRRRDVTIGPNLSLRQPYGKTMAVIGILLGTILFFVLAALGVL